MKSINQLIETRRSEQDAIAKSKTIIGKNTASILSKVNPIIAIMSKAERSVIDEMANELKGFSEIHSIKSRIDNIFSLSESKGLLKIKESLSRCGESYTKSYKIPIAYFDMTPEQILEKHTTWARNSIDAKIEKANKGKIKSKKLQIERLERELKDLTNK